MNVGTIIVVAIVAVAFGLAVRSIVRSGGHSCSGCASCGSCSAYTGAACTGGSGAASMGCPSCDAAQKMIDDAEAILGDEHQR